MTRPLAPRNPALRNAVRRLTERVEALEKRLAKHEAPIKIELGAPSDEAAIGRAIAVPLKQERPTPVTTKERCDACWDGGWVYYESEGRRYPCGCPAGRGLKE